MSQEQPACRCDDCLTKMAKDYEQKKAQEATMKTPAMQMKLTRGQASYLQACKKSGPQELCKPPMVAAGLVARGLLAPDGQSLTEQGLIALGAWERGENMAETLQYTQGMQAIQAWAKKKGYELTQYQEFFMYGATHHRGYEDAVMEEAYKNLQEALQTCDF